MRRGVSPNYICVVAHCSDMMISFWCVCVCVPSWFEQASVASRLKRRHNGQHTQLAVTMLDTLHHTDGREMAIENKIDVVCNGTPPTSPPTPLSVMGPILVVTADGQADEMSDTVVCLLIR